MDDFFDFLFGLFICIIVVVVFIGVVIGIASLIPEPPATAWCNVVTTTGEIETQACPAGFNANDRIYWDNEKHTYAKVG